MNPGDDTPDLKKIQEKTENGEGCGLGGELENTLKEERKMMWQNR